MKTKKEILIEVANNHGLTVEFSQGDLNSIYEAMELYHNQFNSESDKSTRETLLKFCEYIFGGKDEDDVLFVDDFLSTNSCQDE